MENSHETTAEQGIADEQLEAYKNTKADFVDYTRFEDTRGEVRVAAKRQFVEGEEYSPQYDYPKLRFFKDEEATVKKKSAVYESVLELESARSAAQLMGDEARAAELLLYREYQDLRLQKIMLVEASNQLMTSGTSSAQEVARQSFLELGEKLYGSMDKADYLAIMSSERKKVANFEPTNEIAAQISSELKDVYSGMKFETVDEVELISEEHIKKLHDYVWERYGDTLRKVPDTDDDVYYDAEQCAQFMNDALAEGGLAEDGWVVVVDANKANPSTNGTSRKISLPSTTRRNAGELRRLIIHEQEVHARRSENGSKLGVKPIERGTAGYADVEEGFGVLLECAVAGNTNNASFDRARERYMAAGLAYGLDGETPRDAREVYEILWRTIALNRADDGALSADDVEVAKDKAYAHIENAYRGTPFWMKGVIYPKLKVYYEGLASNARFFSERIDTLDEAFDAALIGKYNHVDENEYALVNRITQGS